MSDRQKIVVFGGSGFLGRQIVHEAICSGFDVVAVCRGRESLLPLRTFVGFGRLKIIIGDATDVSGSEWSESMSGARAVVNACGSHNVTGYQQCVDSFVKTTECVASHCAKNGVHLIHLSVLGAETNFSNLMRCKVMAERFVTSCHAPKTIIKSSLVFGYPDDWFFSPYIVMAEGLPFVPFCGGDRVMVQPLKVEDFATSIIKIINLGSDCANKTISLAGPDAVPVSTLINSLCLKYQNKKIWQPKEKASKTIAANILSSWPWLILNRVLTGAGKVSLNNELLNALSVGNYSVTNNISESIQKHSEFGIHISSINL